MQGPLHHLADSTATKYRLQLNVYRYILQKYYNKRVEAMHVVGLHPIQGGEPWVDVVPFMDAEVHAIMQERMGKIQAVQAVEGEKLVSGAMDVRGGSLRATPLAFGLETSWGNVSAELVAVKTFLQILSCLTEAVGELEVSFPDVLGGSLMPESQDHMPAVGDSDGLDEEIDFERDLEPYLPPSQPASSKPTAAKSSPRPPREPPTEQVQSKGGIGTEDEAIKQEGDLEAALAQGNDFASLKRRRLLPGASTSDSEFLTLFQKLHNVNAIFQGKEAELQDMSRTILHCVQAWTKLVKEHAPVLSDHFSRVAVASS